MVLFVLWVIFLLQLWYESGIPVYIVVYVTLERTVAVFCL